MCRRSRNRAWGSRFRFRFLVLLLFLFWFLVPGSGLSRPRSRSERVLVIPFENPAREARIYWLGEASAVLLADDLNAFGKRAYTREERLDAFQRLQVPPVATLESRHGHPAGTGRRRDACRHRLVPADRRNDFGARAEHPARHRPDGARIRRSRTARRSVRHFRARQPAPRGPVGVRRTAAAAGAAGVRELHQRAHRDVDAGEDRLSRSGDQARSRVRSRAARAVERAL